MSVICTVTLYQWRINNSEIEMSSPTIEFVHTVIDDTVGICVDNGYVVKKE